MYKVIGNTNTRTLRVLWAMNEIGLKYEHLKVRAQSSEAQLANVSGKVPSLEVNGINIADSTAIITYLADKYNQLTFPAGTIERAQQDSFTQFILDELDSILWTAARHSFVLPKEMRVIELKDTLHWEFARSLKILESRMGSGPNVMGEEFTIPDIILTHIGGWARVAKFDIPDGKLRDYFRRQIKRPAYISAINL
ncbi:glutathione S-transferase family protein [Amylibacter sp.]|nr:glutathione S-transferase family protein [Amylibacter sp.]MDA9585568.1 glutathione S-transferase family protein [Amylibacter sp.]MDB2523733.1 glutathione S-transferase family protein [Amylibacter sp.]MDB2536237.1 glutathione S-transferase family protein [Amylibacter sp.]